MADSLIQDVSDTAFMVATYRAMESERPDALFRDPLAERLTGGHGRRIVADLRRQAVFLKWMIPIRTCIIDGFIEAAVAQGLDAVLNLGAGLDTRPYRMNLPASLRWIEVDYAKIIALEDSRLSDERPRCRLERVKLDLADIPARRRLFSEIAGKDRKVLVLTEGVIPYLSTQEAAVLADDLRAEPAFLYWIVDYVSPQIRRYRQRMIKKMKMENAPHRFDPKDYLGFFKEHGWQMKEIRYVAQEAQRLNRPLQLPFPLQLQLKLVRLFTPKDQRENLLKSVAYVLLEPSHIG